MADGVLDSLAPAPTQAPTPPPSTPAAAPVASPAPASAPAAAPSAAPAAPAVDHAAIERQILKSLGYESADDARADLEFSRRARAEYQRQAELQRQNDPGRQDAMRRGQALRALVAEGYNPDVADSLAQLPEITQFLNDQRADAANRDLDGALEEIGIAFDGSKESADLRQLWEDALSDKLNANPALNRRYFGTPAERKAVIQEMVATEERRINNVLARQGATALRDHAARAQRSPRGMRSTAALPTVRQATPTATDPIKRRQESRTIVSGQLDDVWNATR